ncbi:Integrase [Acidithiobacillus ferrivorans]|uniref:Integrase n=1 Tax=Acidithiobacillus ferrivorans TaxID=160808 RepID=A0A060UK73_9PROT|nr:site-specific integrase [Acidithiobacillus ferrivorans]CDQ08890.1 putative Site-specific recombinase, phage integrase family [Acidithiobacillus ferrivorans]SMH64190.1 Integrase [Acidithiobacillus ferrivorans]
MATISPRHDQDDNLIGWQAIIRKRGFPSQTKTFRTKRDAEAWAKVTESEMVRGVFIQRTESERTLLSELLDRYATEVVPTLKGGSRDMSRIRTLKAHLGKYAVASITSALVAQYRDSRLATISKSTGMLVGPQTVKHELGMLQRVLKKGAMEWGVLLPGGIPTLQVKMPRLPNSRDRRLVDDEEARLLRGCRESNAAWLYPAVILAIETAMRASELLGLGWDNIDLKGRVAVLPDTKNGTARRVPLSFRAVDALESLPRNINGKVFTVTYRALAANFTLACKRAAINDLRFHDLRHEATSRLSEKGLNPMQMAAITGHKTLQMLKRYTHLRAEDLAKLLG